MNYTEKYHLPQWVKSDRILMDDFNQMCRDMEAGLAKTAQDAAGDASSAAGAAAKAQSTADSALSAAKAAQTSANQAYRPGYAPYVVGSYTGTGGTVELYFGFEARFLIITAQYAGSAGIDSVAVVAPGGTLVNHVKFTSTGASITSPGPSTPPYINTSGHKYYYIAFR